MSQINDHIKGMLDHLQGMQVELLEKVKDHFNNMGPEQGQAFLKAMKDGGIEKIAKDNAAKVVEANKMFGKK